MASGTELYANPNADFGFQPTTGIIPKPACQMPEKNWKKNGLFQSYCMVARSDAASAVKCFLDQPCRMDCLAGQQVLEFDIHRRTFGDESFNSAFNGDPLTIATGDRKAILKNSAHRKTDDRLANLLYSPLYGHTRFIGAPGAIMNVKGEEFLDSPNDRNENFVIVKSTAAAAEDFDRRGGLAALEVIAAKFAGPGGKVSMLNTPFLTQTKVYVFPLGIRSLREHLIRLKEKNPRTPYRFKFYDPMSATYFFPRYTHQLLESGCPGMFKKTW